eukprot:1924957-Pleurochrysis_carterae.AAC.1
MHTSWPKLRTRTLAFFAVARAPLRDRVVSWARCRLHSCVVICPLWFRAQVRLMHEDGKFCVCWDPLDGSSIVDNNWARAPHSRP